jgi:hypothetical protein
VGVLDPFWESKGYVTPDEYSRFCNSTVLLARLPKRYWRSSETLTADIDIAHFGAQALTDAVVGWRLNGAAGTALAQGRLARQDIPVGNGTRLGTVRIPLSSLAPAQKYTLVTTLNGHESENDWDVWVFADHVDTTQPAGVHLCDALDEAALRALNAGDSVLLMLSPARVRTDSTIGFSGVFWNTSWTRRAPSRAVANNLRPGEMASRGQAPHTLGILCSPEHSVFAHFPTEFHSNWQWWELIHGAAAMTMNALPPTLRPLVQPIDTWFDNHRLGLLFEARVAGGRLMVCSMDLESDLDQRIVARQFRHGLLRYMGGAAFEPAIEVTVDAINALAHDRNAPLPVTDNGRDLFS